MSSRTEKLLAVVQPEMNVKMEHTIQRIREEYVANRKQILDDFAKALAICAEKVQGVQPDKGKIKYIYISYLLSSLLDQRLEFRIDFYSSKLYLDEIETEAYWVADFIARCINEDFSYFQGQLRKTLIRVMDYEVMQLTVDFGTFYYSALSFYWAEMLADLSLKGYEDIFEDEVHVLYGGFQDKSICVGKLHFEEDDTCVILL